MLITFHSKVSPEVLMLSEHAVPLLVAAGKMTGNKVPERGVFTAAQLGQAIAGIEKVLAESAPQPAHDDETDEEGRPVPPMARGVNLHQRAFPLLDMMKKSQAEGADVMWEASRGW